MIWTPGGNSFLLRRAMRQSGLDLFLMARWEDRNLVYGGYSAGAVVVTPTLRGIDLVDPPDQQASGYSAEIVWDGLALVPYCNAPHYDSPHPESKLRDGEVIITRAVRPGSEIL